MADRKNPMLTYFQRLQNAREKYSVLATKKKKKGEVVSRKLGGGVRVCAI